MGGENRRVGRTTETVGHEGRGVWRVACIVYNCVTPRAQFMLITTTNTISFRSNH